MERSLFGSPEQLTVDRAVLELRAGRPVLLQDGPSARLIQAADEIDDGRLAALARLAVPGSLRLVLSRARALWLGLTIPDGARSIRIANVTTGHAIGALVFDEAVAPGVTLDFAVGDAIDTRALDLTRFARLAPALLTYEVAPETRADLARLAVTVDVAAIASHAAEAAEAIRIVADAPVPLRPDISSRFIVFRGGSTVHDQVAIIVGAPDMTRTLPLRLHSACLTGDLFGSLKCDCGDQLRQAVERFAELGGGVILYLDQEGRGIGIANKMRAYTLQAEGYDTIDADARLGFRADERRWFDAARMLDLLGIRSVRLYSNNPKKEQALKDAGIEVVSREAVLTRVTAENADYLRTKARRAGHIIDESWINDAEAATRAALRAQR